MSNDALVPSSVDYNEVHQVSLGLMGLIQENEIPPELALPALMMTVGRMYSPRLLEPLEEKTFIEGMAEWLTIFFVDGRAN